MIDMLKVKSDAATWKITFRTPTHSYTTAELQIIIPTNPNKHDASTENLKFH
jgi:hypothetical protein